MNLNFQQFNKYIVRFSRLDNDEKIAWIGLLLGVILVIIALLMF